VLRRPFLAHFVVAMGVALSGPGAQGYAQTAAASDVKAAFIYNFAKFTTWPADLHDAAKSPALCVLGDNTVATALQRTPQAGVELTVRMLKPNDSFAGCRVLYISGIDDKALERVVEGIYREPVLTVSDAPSFAALGGIAEIFDESGRLRFAINVGAAKRAGLTMSARMLSLAKIVKDERRVDP
jgi:hypothetical protein